MDTMDNTRLTSTDAMKVLRSLTIATTPKLTLGQALSLIEGPLSDPDVLRHLPRVTELLEWVDTSDPMFPTAWRDGSYPKVGAE